MQTCILILGLGRLGCFLHLYYVLKFVFEAGLLVVGGVLVWKELKERDYGWQGFGLLLSGGSGSRSTSSRKSSSW